jgi:Holliday junction resolvase RusA-like endonuclease
MKGEPDITLTLPVPPSTNRMWRHSQGRHFKSPEYCAWITEAGYKAALGAAGDKIPGAYALAMTLPPTRLDPDNTIKPCNDLLQHMGIVTNDRLMRWLALTIDEGRADILVRLWALPMPAKRKPRRANAGA